MRSSAIRPIWPSIGSSAAKQLFFPPSLQESHPAINRDPRGRGYVIPRPRTSRRAAVAGAVNDRNRRRVHTPYFFLDQSITFFGSSSRCCAICVIPRSAQLTLALRHVFHAVHSRCITRGGCAQLSTPARCAQCMHRRGGCEQQKIATYAQAATCGFFERPVNDNSVITQL